MSAEGENREKIIDAKLDDLSDRLRLGMNKLQVAVGENKASGGGGGGGSKVNLDEIDDNYEEEMEGIREKLAVQIAGIEEDIVDIKNDIRRQDEVIENKLKNVRMI